MIYSISGEVLCRGEGFLAVSVGGLGLKLFVNQRTLGGVPRIGERATFFCHLAVNEDSLALYGFSSAEELAFFEQLIAVPGVGPKSALAVMDVAEFKELSAAIAENRPDILTRASGIGRRTAERIVIELKGKVHAEAGEATVKRMETDADVVETLVSLGYRRDEAKAALGRIGEENTGLEQRLRAALKVLGSNKALMSNVLEDQMEGK